MVAVTAATIMAVSIYNYVKTCAMVYYCIMLKSKATLKSQNYMKKTVTFLALALSMSAFSQGPCCPTGGNRFDQLSIEAEYGLNYTRSPIQTDFKHWGIGARYMFNEYWGVKADYANDRFSSDNGRKGTGGLYYRLSAQAVYNIGRTLNLPNLTGGRLNMLLHGGAGYSHLNIYDDVESDNMGNVILGGTLQLYISERFALTGDVSGVLNFRQQNGFDSTNVGKTYTGKILNASIGLTYYLGRNKGDADWR
jgi:hypothetical protein